HPGRAPAENHSARDVAQAPVRAVHLESRLARGEEALVEHLYLAALASAQPRLCRGQDEQAVGEGHRAQDTRALVACASRDELAGGVRLRLEGDPHKVHTPRSLFEIVGKRGANHRTEPGAVAGHLSEHWANELLESHHGGYGISRQTEH